MSTLPPDSPRRTTEGAALVEFALISLAFYLLFAGTVELGRLMILNQGLQEATQTAAKQFAQAEFPANYTFEQAMFDPVTPDPVLDTPVYDPRALVIDLTALPEGTQIDDVMATLPVINQSMQFLMILEDVDVEGQSRRLFRMPGTLLINDGFAQNSIPSNPLGLYVQIPKVVGRTADGQEIIEWVNVLEEIRADNSFAAADTGSFSALPTFPGQRTNYSAVRINLPFHSPILSAFMTTADDGLTTPVEAVGVSGLVNPEDQFGRLIGDIADDDSLYGGEYGLGRNLSMGTRVRPFRRLLSAQAIRTRDLVSVPE